MKDKTVRNLATWQYLPPLGARYPRRIKNTSWKPNLKDDFTGVRLVVVAKKK